MSVRECVCVLMIPYLNDHTTLDEVVKGNATLSRPVKFSDQHIVKPIRQPVAKAGQGWRERRQRGRNEKEGGRGREMERKGRGGGRER